MKNTIFILFLLIPVISGAQNTPQSVLGTAGGDYSNNQLSVSWMIGEVMTETYDSDKHILTQGFHQGDLVVSRIAKKLSADFQIKTYPNPVKDILIIETNDTGIEYQVVNINGSIISNGTIHTSTEEIDFTSSPSGTYFLRFENQYSYKIIKK